MTALNPVIGYERSTELAAEAMKTGRGILELIREKKVLTEEQIAKVFDPAAMTGQAAQGMNEPASRSAVLAGAAVVGAPSCRRAASSRPGEGWRPFTATWSLAGPARRSCRPEGEPPAVDRPPVTGARGR